MNNILTLPQNLEAEEAALGAILIEPDTYYNVAQHITAADFHAVKHGWLWSVYTALSESGQAIDLLTVQHELARRGQLEEMGGPAYLTRLVTLTPTAYNAETYAALIQDAATRRRLLRAASDIAKLAYETGSDLKTIIRESQNSVMAVSSPGSSLESMATVGARVWDYVSDPAAASAALLRLGVGAVGDGLGPLDTQLGGGLEAETLTIVAGRPGMGKTALLCQVADYVSERGGIVLFFSKEMSSEQIYLRIAARRARVNLQHFRLQRFPAGVSLADENTRLQNQVVKLFERETLYIDGKKSQTTDEMIALAITQSRKIGKPALILLDHLRLMADVDKSEVKRMGAISWACKRLSGELHCAVIAAAQLNRAVEGRSENRPLLSDLRDSGEIEENADTVLFPFRPNYYKDLPDGEAEINIAKNRNGDGGPGVVARMTWVSQYASFEPERRM